MRIASSSRSVPSASAFAVYSGVFETHLNVALRGKIVDLIRLRLLHQPDDVGGIRHVALMQREPRVLDVRVLVNVFDPGGVERR